MGKQRRKHKKEHETGKQRRECVNMMENGKRIDIRRKNKKKGGGGLEIRKILNIFSVKKTPACFNI